MKSGKVEKYIKERIEKEGALLFVLIDPCDYVSIKRAVFTAKQAYEAGADIILVGGSIGAQGELLDTTVRSIKEVVGVPIVLFPGNIGTITKYADAVYFMSLLNSRNPYWISQAQALAAPVIKNTGIEPIPVGYIVVEPGGTVGWVGDVNLVPRHKPQIAASLALSGQFSGAHFIITDVGSASPLGPVPLNMVSTVKKVIDIPYIVAGGVRTFLQAKNIIKAGGDAIHIGTAAERTKNVKEIIGGFVKVIKEEGKKRLS